MIPLKLVLIYVGHIKETNEKVKRNGPSRWQPQLILDQACQPINEKGFRNIYIGCLLLLALKPIIRGWFCELAL